MSLVCRGRIAFALENMSQMAAAVGAHNLGARHAKGAVCMSRHCARDRVEVGWPAAAGFELMRGLVERSSAGGARVDAGRWHVFIVGARVGGFGALFAKNAELFWLKDIYLASGAPRSCHGMEDCYPCSARLATHPRFSRWDTSCLRRWSC